MKLAARGMSIVMLTLFVAATACEKPGGLRNAGLLLGQLEITPLEFVTNDSERKLVDHLGWDTGAARLRCLGLSDARAEETISFHEKVEVWSDGDVVRTFQLGGGGVTFPFDRRCSISLQQIVGLSDRNHYRFCFSSQGTSDQDTSRTTVEGPDFNASILTKVQHAGPLQVNARAKTAIWALLFDRQPSYAPETAPDYVEQAARHAAGAIVLRVWFGPLSGSD